MIWWDFYFFSGFFCFFLVDCLGGWSQWMRLVFLQEAGDAETWMLPHPLHSLICTKEYHDDCVVTGNDGGKGKDRGWFIYVWGWVMQQGLGIMFFLFFSFFCAAVNYSFMVVP